MFVIPEPLEIEELESLLLDFGVLEGGRLSAVGRHCTFADGTMHRRSAAYLRLNGTAASVLPA